MPPLAARRRNRRRSAISSGDPCAILRATRSRRLALSRIPAAEAPSRVTFRGLPLARRQSPSPSPPHPVLPRRSSERVRESPFKVDRVREHGRHDKTHKVIHGEGSFITSYIAGLHCLGMLLSASVSRRITSSVRRYTRVSTPFPCPLAARASAPSFEGGFIRGTCSMILIISSLPTRITEICYRRR
jgi:hypothetical protein